MSYMELESTRKILRPEKCQMMLSLITELQMTEDRIDAKDEADKDDPHFADVLTLELAEREKVITAENIEFMIREADLTTRIMRFDAHNSWKTKTRKKIEENNLVKAIQEHNNKVEETNRKRGTKCDIVKASLVKKWKRDWETKYNAIEIEIRKNKDTMESLQSQILPDKTGANFVIVPNSDINIGNVKEYVRQINEGTASSTSQQVVLRGSFTMEEFEGLHDKISKDMKMSEYKGTINMSDIEFYSYDRVQVFKKIFDCANKDSITGKLSKKDLAADITDICFIWLVRGTNFEKIKDGLNQETQKRIGTLISRYGFKNRTIDTTTKMMARLQNDTLTVSRFCDLYPMRVWALWHNSDETQRPGFMTHTNFSKKELKTIRSLRCPSLPYLCSRTRPDKTKDCAPFKSLLAFHSYFLLDFDRLMYSWVKDRPNMPKEFKPRLGLISQIVKKKVMAKDFVPKDEEKYKELKAAKLIVGENPSEMREDPVLVEDLVPIAKKIISSVMSEQLAIEGSLKDILAILGRLINCISTL